MAESDSFLQREWLDFASRVYPNATPQQLVQLKLSFYAGAYSVFLRTNALGDEFAAYFSTVTRPPEGSATR